MSVVISNSGVSGTKAKNIYSFDSSEADNKEDLP